MFFLLAINGGVGCFIVSGGIGSSVVFSVCRVIRGGSFVGQCSGSTVSWCLYWQYLQ